MLQGGLLVKQLADKFGRIHTYLRIAVTDRCNLRCRYCMPSSGIEWKEHNEILTFEEITRLAKIFVELGIKKIRITGGEPLVRKNIEKLIEQLASLKRLETLAMTTNGVLLKDKAQILKEAGLSTLNISLDTLRQERFIQITNMDNLNNVLMGIGMALGVGFKQLKLNTVVMRGINDDEILDFVDFAKDKPINVRFIELMPFKGNNWDFSHFVPYLEIKKKIEEKFELIPIKNNQHDVAKDFCIEGFQGTVSFITSMTDSFCNSCNRVRLTANGSIKSCLFQKAEVNLRNAIQENISDTKIIDMIQHALTLKQEGHPNLEELVKLENQSMIEIGG